MRDRRIFGIELRYVIMFLLMQRGAPMSVAELVVGIDTMGFQMEGRPSKRVSDSLRSEVSRGRIRRIGRNLYTVGTIPRETRSRIRRRVAAMRIVAERWDATNTVGAVPDRPTSGGERYSPGSQAMLLPLGSNAGR
jgi:hypothetical protein